jgi:hypothetical protein
MPLEPHQVRLVTATGALLLQRARVLEDDEEFDLDVDRPPFSETTFAEGTGNARPPTITIAARLQGATIEDADALLAELEDVAAVTTRVEWRDLRRASSGMTGELVVTPTLKGHRVQFRLAMTELDWSPQP